MTAKTITAHHGLQSKYPAQLIQLEKNKEDPTENLSWGKIQKCILPQWYEF